MNTAILITQTWEVTACLPLAVRLARSRGESLTVLHPVDRDGDEKVVRIETATKDEQQERAAAQSEVGRAIVEFVQRNESVALATGDSDDAADTTREVEHPATTDDPRGGDPLPVTVIEMFCSQPSRPMLETVQKHDLSLLILPRHLTERGLDPESELVGELRERAPCSLLTLRPGLESPAEPRSILVPAGGDPPSLAAIRTAVDAARRSDVTVTTLYVEPNVDQVAERVGKRIAQRIVSNALDAEDYRLVKSRVVLADRVADGIARAAEGQDMILIGASNHGLVRRWRKKSVSGTLLGGCKHAVVAVLTPPAPLTSRLGRAVEGRLKAVVPQLDREQRVTLVEKLQSSSRWDFDFITLICLSTLIAALGLMQDSGAVVIGAMLVAPLMTPLIGAGMSLVQGNLALIRNASKSVLLGFLLAFIIGLLLGLMPSTTVTDEMLARCSPNLRDFVIAFVSGVAAAYALGRPNLLGALPGVAIAAALVPPIATAGITMAQGHPRLAAGALLLFLTNIVVIVLGTAFSLWLVGIRGTHQHGERQKWALQLVAALSLLALALAVYESLPHRRVLTVAPDGRDSVGLTAEVDSRIREEIHRFDPLSRCLSLRRADGVVELLIARPSAPSADQVAELARIVREQLDTPLPVRLETRLTTTVPVDSP